MEKLIRYYNQNRVGIWVVVLLVAFIILIIHTINGTYKGENQQANSENGTNADIEQNYEEQSKSLIEAEKIPEIYQKDFSSIIDNFLTYCKNHEPEKAYGLLTDDCKQVLYPTVEIFINQYYKPKFSTEKVYQFQNWTAKGAYVYLVKIYENTLASGKGSNEVYIQDYITVMMENGTYKLNVNSFVGKVHQNAEASSENVNIKVESSEIYMDYEIATVTIKNNREEDIWLDSRRKTDSTYVIDSNEAKSEALLYENSEEDLQIKAGEEKKIKIKFSDTFQSGRSIKQYVFSDVRIQGYPRKIIVEV